MQQSATMLGVSGKVFLLFLALATPAMANRANVYSHVSLKDSTNSRPRTPVSPEISQIFEKAFHDEGIYEKGACPVNIRRLVGQLNREKIDLSKARVLYLKRSTKGEDLIPQRAREGIAEWGFHVVLEIEGKILDLDFTQDPTPAPARDYFSLMFASSYTGRRPSDEELQTQLKMLTCRAIPALEYLAEYKEDDSYKNYRDGTVRNRNYPAQTAWEFLQSLPAAPPPPREDLQDISLQGLVFRQSNPLGIWR